jgi:O-antigen/teichoic acid export membrane protein
MTTARDVARNTTVRTAALFGEKLLIFAVMAIMARHYGSSAFGVYSFALSFVSFFRLLSDWGMNPIVIRRLSIAASDEERSELFSTALTVRVLLAVVTGLLAGGAFSLAHAPAFDKLAVWIATLTMSDVVADMAGSLLQAYLRQTWMGVVGFAARVIWAALSIAAIFSGRSILFLVFAMGVCSLLQAAGLLVAGRRLLRFGLGMDRGILKGILRDSWPLALQAVMSTVYLRIDQLLLYALVGAQSVGIYAAATRLAEPWGLAAGVFVSATFPMLCRTFVPDTQGFHRISRATYRYLFIPLMLLIAYATLFAAPILRLIFGPGFEAGAPALVTLMWAEVFLFANMVSQYVLVAAGAQKVTFFLSAAGAVSNVALNLVLIPRYGATGAGVASLISYAFYQFLQSALPQTREFSIPVWSELFRPALACIGVVLALRVVRLSPGLALAIVPAGYVVALFAIGGLRSDDWRRFRACIPISRESSDGSKVD